MIYRERYGLNQEYRVLAPKAIELLVSGTCDSEEELLKGSTLCRFDMVSTILTEFGGEFLQYSVASQNLGGLQSLMAFDGDSVKEPVANCSDIAILQKGLGVSELLELSRREDLLVVLASDLELNSGNVINDFHPEVGQRLNGDEVLAGYLIKQRAHYGVSIEVIALPSKEWEEFCYDMEYGDSRLTVLKEYLLNE